MVHCNAKHVSNLIVLITKYYIYSSRCQQKNLNIIAIKEELKSICIIEKYYAVKTDKVQLHNEKWIQCLM